MERRGELGQELYELGLRLGRLGAVAVGSGGGPLARALARIAGGGAALSGGEVKFHDGDCAGCGAWVGRYYNLPAALFIRQEGDGVDIYLSDGEGRSFHRRLDGGGPASAVGEWDLLAGADCAWAASRAGDYRGELGPACAHGPAALTLALERLGYEVSGRETPGAVVFEAGREGFALRVREGGAPFDVPGRDALAAAAEFTRQPRAVPAFRRSENGRA